MKPINSYNTSFFAIYVFLIFLFSFGNTYISLSIITIIEILRQIKKENFVTVYTFWLLGFFFIICLDGYLLTDRIITDTSELVYYKTSYLFHISLLIIIFYYRRLENKRKPKAKHQQVNKLNNTFLISIVFLYVFFIILQLPGALEALSTSRNQIILNNELGGLNENKSIFKTIGRFVSEFIGFLLPSFIFVWNIKYFNPLKALLFSFLVSAPIWIIYFGLGTRHFIVYSFLGLIACFALVKSKKIKFKYYYFVFIILGLLVSNIMLESRRHGFVNYIFGVEKEKRIKVERHVTDLTTVYMSYAVEHHLEKPLYFGRSTGAVLFFWIPRKLWKDKPTQFGYWFIRDYYGKDYTGFSKNHSAPASYIAAPYSDFGYLGVILISFLIGLLLNKVDVFFRKNRILSDYRKLVFVSFFLASVFFLPRQLSHLVIKVFVLYIFLIVFFYFVNKKYVLNTKN